MSQLMINAKEIGEIVECSEAHAYKIIRQLNDELTKKGYLTRSGRVPRKYFFERMGLDQSYE